MGGSSGEVEAFEVAAAVAGLEGSEQAAVAGEAVDGSVQDVVAGVDVLGGEGGFEDDSVFQVFQAGGFRELFQDGAAVGGKHGLPVVVRAQVGGVDEDVEGLAARGGHGGIGGGGGAEVTGRVRGGLAPAVDGVEFLLRVVREDEVVVEEVGVGAVQPQVEDDSGAGGLVFTPLFETTGRPRPVEKLTVGAHGVAVGDEGGEGNAFAAVRFNS